MRCAPIVVLGFLAVAANAYAYEEEDRDKLRETGSCPECDLSGITLPKADLSGADLHDADLGAADLSGAQLGAANLIGANLRAANLSGANLREARLREADLREADLREADLYAVDLFDADLSEADLSMANLTGANLTGAILLQAHLRAARLRGANLSAADLGAADLSGARLGGAAIDARSGLDLVGAVSLSATALMQTDLSGSDLRGVDLSGAFLYRVNLAEADLFSANLNWAELIEVDLAGADLTRVEMGEARYEPVSAPRVETMSRVEGLASLRWFESPHGLNLLRQAFKKAGMRRQERQVTYAVRHWERINAGGIEGALTYLLFEITSDWGLSPGRPLKLVILLILVFAAPYMAAVVRVSETGSGIWRVWPQDRIDREEGNRSPCRVRENGYLALAWALYFSLLSAVRLGWRDPDVGGWIARIHPQEYALRATGWIKVVSGVQSLISVYLIALSALTYFARPFG